MTKAHIREGNVRNGFTIMYHDLFDLYHEYIGDKALLYYTFLLRYRNTDKNSELFGKAWNGRRGVVDRFQFSYSTIPLIDEILDKSGLIDIETESSGRGRDKIYYVVHDPLPREEFREKEPEIEARLVALMSEEGTEGVRTIIGKKIKPARNTGKVKASN